MTVDKTQLQHSAMQQMRATCLRIEGHCQNKRCMLAQTDTHLLNWYTSRLGHQEEGEKNGQELPHPKEDVNAPFEGAQHV